jgi:3-deoxy-manno-octulosonate cytidylyltransferase (CMP-KDO synthetase)
MRAVIIIPARYASTRLPGKLLLRDTGKYLIQHTYEAALGSRRANAIIIAADDDMMLEAAAEFGAQAVRTRTDHASGTDRIAEVATDTKADIVVNLQGDEPEADPNDIDRLIDALTADKGYGIATLAAESTDPAEHADPNLVKVVVNPRGEALYFSRAPIPCHRDSKGAGSFLKHIGIYAYRYKALMRMAGLPETALEKAEKLEQLRAIENGIRIRVLVTDHEPVGVDTAADYERFAKRMAEAAKE